MEIEVLEADPRRRIKNYGSTVSPQRARAEFGGNGLFPAGWLNLLRGVASSFNICMFSGDA